MPSITDLVPSATMDDFKAIDEVKMFTQVYNRQDKSTLICKGGGEWDCLVRYHWNYTPIIYGVYPQVLYHGQVSNVFLNPTEAPRGKKAGDLPVTIKLDGFRMDHEGYLDTDTEL